ncbi:MAG: hypothetical protein KAI74_05240 [Kiritimatiellae bacterium]|nr:hypothetical protein [Kiritimatiellia bacterium]
MTVVTGIGYITKGSCGGIRQDVSYAVENIKAAYTELKAVGVLDGKVKNFGRFDNDSKRALLVSGLALQDAGIEYPLPEDYECGIILGNQAGAVESNYIYFKDYVDSGRIISRGNLFVYTLPTSSIGEAAIYYGLRGPLLYVSNSDPLPTALMQAADIIEGNESESMLVLSENKDEMICFVLENSGSDKVQSGIRVEEFIKGFNAAQDFTILEFLWPDCVGLD